LLERCAALNIPVTQTYGMTETASQAVTLAPEDALLKLGSAGKVLYPSELRLENEGQPVKLGEVGEILLRGPIVTPGYAGRPEESAQILQNGWLHTGDLGKLDTEGYLYIVDRRTDLIISGGENIYPAEVEAVLLAHPQIEEAGIIGLQDERWVQIVAAAVKLRPESSLTEGEIIEWCLTRLAKYKVPKHVKFLDSLPRNAAGKLVRRQLRENWQK
jgi:O-succinylbenzoic acid--CoA ligase